MRKLLTFLIALAATAVTSIAIAHTDGIYNPPANPIPANPISSSAQVSIASCD